MTLRYYLLQSHYRSTTEFKKDAIEAAAVGYQKLLSAYQKLSETVGNLQVRSLSEEELTHQLVRQFIQEMNDDFNTPKAIAILYDLAKETNILLKETSPDVKKLETLWQIWNTLGGQVLGILPTKDTILSDRNRETLLPSVMEKVIGWRNQARAKKDFALSDAIRDDLSRVGIMLEDAKEGTKWALQ